MKLMLSAYLILTIISSVLTLAGYYKGYPIINKQIGTKKGYGLSKGHTVNEMKSLNVSWYYNWAQREEIEKVSDITFIPSVNNYKEASKVHLKTSANVSYVFGYNEPDHKTNPPHTPKQCASSWHHVEKAATYIGSPSMMHNPATKTRWLKEFLKFKPKPKVDFIVVHWYFGASAQRFINDMETIYNYFKKPIWVKEYAPHIRRHAILKPYHYTVNEVVNFVNQTTRWMEKTRYIHRYAFHDSQYGNTKLFNQDKTLTKVGKAYRNVVSHPFPFVQIKN